MQLWTISLLNIPGTAHALAVRQCAWTSGVNQMPKPTFAVWDTDCRAPPRPMMTWHFRKSRVGQLLSSFHSARAAILRCTKMMANQGRSVLWELMTSACASQA